MDKNEFYKKQIALPYVGESGQEKLLESKALIIGAGALGSPAILYLAAAGIGVVGICDNDVVESSNLPRQVLYSLDDIGQYKSELAASRVENKNPFTKVKTYVERVNEDNIDRICSEYDVILDCSDNLKTKFLIHDYAYKHKKDLVQGSIYQFEGQTFVFPFSKREEHEVGCYRCLWSNIPGKYQENTSGSGVIGVVPGMIGLMQASEAIKLLLNINNKDSSLAYLYNSLNNETRNFYWDKNDECKFCV